MVILKKFKPDLSIISIPTYPSGLAIVTNLNPQSTALKSHYDAIVAEAMKYMLTPYLESLEGNSSMMNNDFDAVFRRLEIIRPVTAQRPESGR